MADTISLRDHTQPCEHDTTVMLSGQPNYYWCLKGDCPGGQERTYRQIRLVRMGGIDPAWYQAKPDDVADEVVLVEVTE